MCVCVYCTEMDEFWTTQREITWNWYRAAGYPACSFYTQEESRGRWERGTISIWFITYKDKVKESRVGVITVPLLYLISYLYHSRYAVAHKQQQLYILQASSDVTGKVPKLLNNPRDAEEKIHIPFQEFYLLLWSRAIMANYRAANRCNPARNKRRESEWWCPWERVVHR